MNLSANQKLIVNKIQMLIGQELCAAAIKRNVIAIDLPDGERYNYSALQIKLEKVCTKYGFAKSVQSCGAGRVALML